MVQVVLQDRAGFLWAGTQNGLFRYDGSRFTSFGKADGLPAGRIDSLHEAVDGTLWVGTHLGLAMRSGSDLRQGERFEPVAMGVASRGERDGRRSRRIRAGICTSPPNSGLAIGTKAPKGWRFHLVGSCPGILPEERVSAVYVDSTGTVWYGCGASALCRLKNGQVSEVGEAEGLPPDRWEAILEDLEGNIWVRSERRLAARSPVTRRFQVRSGNARGLPGAGALPPATNTVPTLALDPDGNLLVPTSQGLARQTRQGWELVGADQGLTTNDISAVEQDREGSIWIGLLGSGLARWLGYREWEGWNERDGLSRESVWAAARDTSGRLWVGTQFGLDYADEKDGRVVWKHRLAGGLEIRALAAAPDGKLWVGGTPRREPRGSRAESGPAQPGAESLAGFAGARPAQWSNRNVRRGTGSGQRFGSAPDGRSWRARLGRDSRGTFPRCNVASRCGGALRADAPGSDPRRQASGRSIPDGDGGFARPCVGVRRLGTGALL